ncbi:hypothetical protein [Yinghuangia soli]|uniref:Uncharacterized protein n=1 Tax=Yinghuangia soli TaxID=2908204 RepID=A0AA41QBV3_9ACTN|nr:hypothetical protein [Yinghuangia soli]MCF2534009.1 hypothetical protein [Yinghuangia soli]
MLVRFVFACAGSLADAETYSPGIALNTDLSPFEPGRIAVTAVALGPELTLVRGTEPRPIVLTSVMGDSVPGRSSTLVALPHGLSPAQAAELSAALALVVAKYDAPLARSIANRIDVVLEAEADGKRIPVGDGMGLTRGWFEEPVEGRSTTRRRP